MEVRIGEYDLQAISSRLLFVREDKLPITMESIILFTTDIDDDQFLIFSIADYINAFSISFLPFLLYMVHHAGKYSINNPEEIAAVGVKITPVEKDFSAIVQEYRALVRVTMAYK